MSTTGQRRQYDSSGRQAQAQATRLRVLAVATRLFVAQGYAGTSIAQIAREAAVSAPTVFAGFRSKVNLLKESIDVALAGDDEPIPLADRPPFRRAMAAPTLDEMLPAMADAYCGIAVRGAPIGLVAYAAADSDAEIGQLAASLDEQRLAGAAIYARRIAVHIGRDGDEAEIERLRDEVWVLCSPELFDLLMMRRGWSAEAYRNWILTGLRGACGQL